MKISIGNLVEHEGVVYGIVRPGKLRAFDAASGEKVFLPNDTLKVRQIMKTTKGVFLAVTENTIYRIDKEREFRPFVTGFSNLSNMTEDIATGYLYVYDNDTLLRINSKIVDWESR